MKKHILITGADRGLGLALTQEFLRAGDAVFAGQFMPEWTELDALRREYDVLIPVPLDVSNTASVQAAHALVASRTDHLDYLINNAGIARSAGDIHALEDPDRGMDAYNTNCLGPLRMVNTFLPLLASPKSEKRLCFVSSECGSISVCHRADDFLYPMSKSALNMAVKMLFSELQPDGYTFRLYHPGWVQSYMGGKKSTAGKFSPEESAAAGYRYFTEPLRNEDVLRIIDNEGAAWPF